MKSKGPSGLPALRSSVPVLLVAVIVLLGGCGGGVKAPDLFIVTRTGSVPGADLTVLVNEEGGVSCNRGPTLKLSDSQLVQARAIQEEVHDSAEKQLVLPPAPGLVFSYHLRDENGTVSFSDNSAHQPKYLHQLELLILEVAQGTCHLQM
jgi:hypothetical protein